MAITHPCDARGFTLLEILVALVILTIVMGSIGLELSAASRVTTRDQAQRVALLVRALRNQAILEGNPMEMRFDSTGYRFFQLNLKGKWQPVTRDHLFRPRQVAAGVHVAVAVQGSGHDEAVRVSPGGNLTPFTVTMTDGSASWAVTGAANGDVSVQPAS